MPPKPVYRYPVALFHGLPYGIPLKASLANIRTENRNALQGYLLQGGTCKAKAERVHTFKGKAKRTDPLERVLYALPFLAKPC
jgi:hypothetical protein